VLCNLHGLAQPARFRGVNLELQILQKTYDMMLYVYPALTQYPKSERHTLVAEIKTTMANMVRLIIRANKERQKLEHLRQLDAELELLRTQVRLSMDLQFLPIRKYEQWSRLLAEIGKMLGGWIKSTRY
jgi:four helix bundle protein